MNKKTIIIVADNMSEAIKGLTAITASMKGQNNVLISYNAEDLQENTEDNSDVIKDEEIIEKTPQKVNHVDVNTPRSVVKRDKDGNIECVYNSIMDASLGENVSYSTMHNIIDTKRIMNGSTFYKNCWDKPKTKYPLKHTEKNKLKVFDINGEDRTLQGIFDTRLKVAEFLGCNLSAVNDSINKKTKIRRKYLVVIDAK